MGRSLPARVRRDRRIRERRFTTVLGDVVRAEPGVDSQRASSSMGGIFVRGVAGKNVAIYRDGVRYTTSAHSTGDGNGAPPDLEGGVPPATVNLSLLYAPAKRYWVEGYTLGAHRQTRLSSLALADRRTGAARSRSAIANFFNHGAAVRGLVAGGRLLPTGEALAEVQTRVLGDASSAPLFPAQPGYLLLGVRGGYQMGENADLYLDLANLTDRNYRGMGWGIDGPGRGVTVGCRWRF